MGEALQPNQGLAGDVLDTRSARSASGACEGFAYTASSRQCQLKANLSGTYPNEGVIASTKSPAQDACSPYGDTQPKRGLAGELIATKFALSPSQCCRHCSSLSGCEGFSYASEL